MTNKQVGFRSGLIISINCNSYNGYVLVLFAKPNAEQKYYKMTNTQADEFYNHICENYFNEKTLLK